MGRERPWEGGGCCGECVGLCTRALPRLSRSLRRRSVLGLCVLPVLGCTIPRRRPWLSVVVVWRAALGGRPPFRGMAGSALDVQPLVTALVTHHVCMVPEAAGSGAACPGGATFRGLCACCSLVGALGCFCFFGVASLAHV